MKIEYSKDKRSAKVLSSNGSTWYDVTEKSCTCPHFAFRMRGRGGLCKHMKKAFYEVEENSNLELQSFKDGIDMDDAYTKYGDDKINTWIRMGEILLLKRKFILLR